MSRIDTNAVIYGIRLIDQTYDPSTYPVPGTRLLYSKADNEGTSALFVQDSDGNVYGPLTTP